MATVSTPPEVRRLAANPARSKMPALTLRSPAMLMLRAKVTLLAELEMITLLNAVEEDPPTVCAAVPLNVTVATPAVNAVPDELFVQLPFTAMLKLLALSVPADKVRLLLIVMADGNSKPPELLRVRLKKEESPENVC